MSHLSLFEEIISKVEADIALLSPAPTVFHSLRARLHIYRQALQQLHDFLNRYVFPSKEEEIVFFKTRKPMLYSRYIFYLQQYNIELRKPVALVTDQIYFFQRELKRLQENIDAAATLYQYYRSHASHLDHLYFTRGAVLPEGEETDSLPYQHDQFSSPMDFQFAQFRATEMLMQWIEVQLVSLPTATVKGNSLLQWTGPKVALVELIYGLQATGVYNHGKATLKDLVQHFEQVYQQDLGNYHHAFNEMRLRKKERLPLISEMHKKVIERMDALDTR